MFFLKNKTKVSMSGRAPSCEGQKQELPSFLAWYSLSFPASVVFKVCLLKSHLELPWKLTVRQSMYFQAVQSSQGMRLQLQ